MMRGDNKYNVEPFDQTWKMSKTLHMPCFQLKIFPKKCVSYDKHTMTRTRVILPLATLLGQTYQTLLNLGYTMGIIFSSTLSSVNIMNDLSFFQCNFTFFYHSPSDCTQAKQNPNFIYVYSVKDFTPPTKCYTSKLNLKQPLYCFVFLVIYGYNRFI